MTALRLTISLLRIPRLFLSLVLGPLFIGLIIVVFQLTMLMVHVGTNSINSEYMQDRQTFKQMRHPGRLFLFGDWGPLDEPKICRWETDTPPPGCEIGHFDLVLRNNYPQTFPVNDYKQLFENTTRKIHVCRNCLSEVVVDTNTSIPSLHLRTLAAGIIPFMLKDQNSRRNDLLKRLYEENERLDSLVGSIYLYLPNLQRPIRQSAAKNDLMILMNVAVLIVIALWLSLRSHRKVLDYFARNGALLPLVAAHGKSSFYSALWFITLLRVSLFLGTAIPTTVYIFYDSFNNPDLETSISISPSEICLWILGLLVSLSFLTILGSISELKHRRPLIGFAFRYIPLVFCLVGGLVSLSCLAFSSPILSWVSLTLAALPITGILPLIMSPILNFSHAVLAWHIILSFAALLIVCRLNSQWFAAHLEEL